jgi:hypothetical protein
VRNAAVAQARLLSVWQLVQESGICDRPADAGEMNLNV